LPAFVGGDLYINKAEATTATTLSLLAVPGDTITGVTVSGTLNAGRTTPAVSWTSGATTATFDATAFADGTVTVTVKSSQSTAGKTATLTLDTVLPAAFTSLLYAYFSTPYVGAANLNTTNNPATTSTTLYVYTNTNTTLSSVSVTGVDKVTGLARIEITTTNTTYGNNYRYFDATKFANGQLAVDAIVTDAAGNTLHQSSQISMTTNGIAPTLHTVNYATNYAPTYLPVNLANSGTRTIIASDLIVLFPYEASVAVAGVTTGAPFTAAMVGGSLVMTANSTGVGYGSVQLAATESVANGSNVLAMDFSVAVTSGSGSFSGTGAAGSATVNSAAGLLYDGTTGIAANATVETFDISGVNTNAVMKGGSGVDTFKLNYATMDFAHILGGTGTLDVLQLTTNYKNIDLSQFNHLGQQVISHVEQIDMALGGADTTVANKVTLTAGDLFLMHSNKTDTLTIHAINTTADVVTIKGTSLDTVSMMSDGFKLYTNGIALNAAGGENGFSSTGTATASGGYSKYYNTYNDTSGAHLVEVLLQTGVVVI
jgi:hypothetical protein